MAPPSPESEDASLSVSEALSSSFRDGRFCIGAVLGFLDRASAWLLSLELAFLFPPDAAARDIGAILYNRFSSESWTVGRKAGSQHVLLQVKTAEASTPGQLKFLVDPHDLPGGEKLEWGNFYKLSKWARSACGNPTIGGIEFCPSSTQTSRSCDKLYLVPQSCTSGGLYQ